MNVQTCVLFTREQLEALIECVDMQISRGAHKGQT